MRTAPSMRTTAPFIIGFSITARTMWANSAGWPGRWGKGTSSISVRRVCSGIASYIPVSKVPGASATTRMP